MYNELGIDAEVVELFNEEEKEIQDIFNKISISEEKNTLKVLSDFHKY